MGQLKDFQFEEDKLCIFYLGGRTKGCHIELHDVVFLAGKSSNEIKPQIKEIWFGTPESLHVDSWYPVENVMGYDVSLSKEKPQSISALKLYFVNVGAYLKGQFGELHFIKLVVAKNQLEAKNLAKKELLDEYVEVHTDDILEVDDCHEVKITGFHIQLIEKGIKKNPPSINGWLQLD